MDLPTERSKVVKKRTYGPPGPWSNSLTATIWSCGPPPSVRTDPPLKAVVSAPNWKGLQVTETFSHPSWRRRRNLPFQDIGGPFFTSKQKVESSGAQQTVISRYSQGVPACQATLNVYRGVMLPRHPSLMPLPGALSRTSDSVLNAWGAKAIAGCKPTNAVASTGELLVELAREGIPKLGSSAIEGWLRGTERARKAPASDYLNYEFGWKPLVGEMRSFMNAIYNAERILMQFERDSGKMVRRRFDFPLEASTTSSVVSSRERPYTNPSGGGLGIPIDDRSKVVLVSESSTRRWFSGAFTYYVPSGYSTRAVMSSYAQKVKKLLGLQLTPELIWNLAPWTWALDWITNFGDVISNISDWSSDGLVLRYGYLMEHKLRKDTYTFVGPTGFYGSSARPGQTILVSETKSRVRANPFGFGITWGGLSPRQIAITTALGITRS